MIIMVAALASGWPRSIQRNWLLMGMDSLTKGSQEYSCPERLTRPSGVSARTERSAE